MAEEWLKNAKKNVIGGGQERGILSVRILVFDPADEFFSFCKTGFPRLQTFFVVLVDPFLVFVAVLRYNDRGTDP